jgi:uncharacterized protein with NRDE domain
VCLILVGWRSHSDFPLVLAANRDESYSRPTATAAFWPDRTAILAGRDLLAGGTWLGMTRSGRLAALTNFRDGGAVVPPDAVSRGVLVQEFLSAKASPDEFLECLQRDKRRFAGYNLLVGDGREMSCYSNVNGTVHRLPPGIYGLSNHFLDTPWPKVTEGKSALATAMDSLPDETRLFSLLASDTVHPDRLLPDTGIRPDWERMLSAAFVRAPGYGTRSSTVLIVDRSGNAAFTEKTWRQGAEVVAESRFRFRITGPAAAVA